MAANRSTVKISFIVESYLVTCVKAVDKKQSFPRVKWIESWTALEHVYAVEELFGYVAEFEILGQEL